MPALMSAHKSDKNYNLIPINMNDILDDILFEESLGTKEEKRRREDRGSILFDPESPASYMYGGRFLLIMTTKK